MVNLLIQMIDSCMIDRLGTRLMLESIIDCDLNKIWLTQMIEEAHDRLEGFWSIFPSITHLAATKEDSPLASNTET